MSRGRTGPDTAGPLCNVDPVPFNLMLLGGPRQPGVDSYTGMYARISWGVGGARATRTVFLGTDGQRISGRAVSVEIEAALRTSADAARLVGGIAWDPDAGTEVSPAIISNLIGTPTLSYAQASADSAIVGVASLGSVQGESRVISVSSDGLTGGSSMVPVQVIVYGRRYVGSGWVRLDSFLVSPDSSGTGIGGDQIIASIAPGEYDRVGYQVVGFPSGAVGVGGSATLQIFEELDPD